MTTRRRPDAADDWRRVAPDLPGRWAIRRTVRGQARFQGEACVTDMGGGRFAWREAGRLVLAGGATLPAHRRYVYRLEPDARRLTILHDDGPDAGAVLHRFDFPESETRVLATHAYPCGPDLYLARLTFLASDGFRLAYAVAGPRKGYLMASSYRRLSEAA